MDPLSTRYLLIVAPNEKKMGVIDSSIQRDKVESKDIKEVNVAIKSLKGFKGAINSLKLLSPFRTWVKVGIQGRTDETGKLHKVLMDINKLAKATGLKKSDIRKLVRSGNGVAKLEAAMNGVAISELTKPVPKPKSTKKVKAQKGAEGKVEIPFSPFDRSAKDASLMGSTEVSKFKRAKGELPQGVKKLNLNKMKPTKTKNDRKGHLHVPSEKYSHGIKIDLGIIDEKDRHMSFEDRRKEVYENMRPLPKPPVKK